MLYFCHTYIEFAIFIPNQNTLIFVLGWFDIRMFGTIATAKALVWTKHGRIPENVRRLHIIADKCGYLQVCKSKILIYVAEKGEKGEKARSFIVQEHV